MRGNPQAASLRLRAAVPGRRWSTRLEQAQETRRRARMERAEAIARLQADERRARQAGAYVTKLRPWL